MKTTNQHGFTLYELMITVLIAGIVLSMGIPNFRDFTANSRMTSTANDLHSAFHLARAEAARAKTNITICSSLDPLDPNPVCSGTFNNGWIVFQDNNGDIVRDAGERVIRTREAVATGISISTPGMNQYFSFASTGLGRGNVAGPPITTAIICDGRGNQTATGGASTARALVITPLGRATVVRNKGRVDTIITNTGASCP